MMDLELPEYLLLAVAVVLGLGVRHWWKNHRQRSERDQRRS
jgi:hypothetical protein